MKRFQVEKVCPVCNKRFSYKNYYERTYCSRKCRNQADRRGEKNPNFGHHWSSEQKVKAGERWVNLIKMGKIRAYTNTAPHLRLESLIKSCGFEVIKEAIFSPYLIDCFLPEAYIGMEADGKIFHSVSRDEKRDAVLLANYHLPVVRFSEKDLMNKSMESAIKEKIFLSVETLGSSLTREIVVATAVGKRPSYVGKKNSQEHNKNTSDGLKQYYKINKPWNFGLTKGTDERLVKIGEHISQAVKGKSRRVRKARIQKECPVCKNTFEILESSQQSCCGRKCGNILRKGCQTWNRGLTKETDSRVRAISEKLVASWDKSRQPWNKGLTKKTDARVKLVGDKISKASISKKVKNENS